LPFNCKLHHVLAEPRGKRVRFRTGFDGGSGAPIAFPAFSVVVATACREIRGTLTESGTRVQRSPKKDDVAERSSARKRACYENANIYEQITPWVDRKPGDEGRSRVVSAKLLRCARSGRRAWTTRGRKLCLYSELAAARALVRTKLATSRKASTATPFRISSTSLASSAG